MEYDETSSARCSHGHLHPVHSLPKCYWVAVKGLNNLSRYIGVTILLNMHIYTHTPTMVT